jgi:hypothetical protein
MLYNAAAAAVGIFLAIDPVLCYTGPAPFFSLPSTPVLCSLSSVCCVSSTHTHTRSIGKTFDPF